MRAIGPERAGVRVSDGRGEEVPGGGVVDLPPGARPAPAEPYEPVARRRDRAPLWSMSGAPGAPRRLWESLLSTWTVAGGLIAVVYSVGPVKDAVGSAPWLMGPGLWVMTALGGGMLLRRLPGRSYPARALAVATLAGGAADALVVSTGHPWPGLVTGVGVFSVAMALLGGAGGRRLQHGAPRPRAGDVAGGASRETHRPDGIR